MIFISVKDLLIKNSYNFYTAASCKLTGLPMIDSSDYRKHANEWLSASKCKAIKQPVKDDEQPVAFYRCKNGYCALYYREDVDITNYFNKKKH